MKRSELLEELSYLVDYTAISKEVYEKIGYRIGNKKAKTLENDMRVRNSVEIRAYSEALLKGQIRFIAYYIVCIIASYEVVTPTKEEIQDMLDICGYTSDDMTRYVEKNLCLPRTSTISPRLLPFVYIFSRILFEAMYDRKTWRNKKGENLSLNRLIKFVDYLNENRIIGCYGEEELKEYNNFVIESATYLLKRKCIDMDHKLFDKVIDDKIESTDKKFDKLFDKIVEDNYEKQSRVFVPIADGYNVNKEFDIFVEKLLDYKENEYFEGADEIERLLLKFDVDESVRQEFAQISKDMKMLDSLWEEVLIKCDEMLDEINETNRAWKEEIWSYGIAQGALQAIMAGDDIFKTKLGDVVFMDLILMSNIPTGYDFVGKLDDDLKWDYNCPDMNGDLGEYIYNWGDIVDLPFETIDGDRIFTNNYPVGAALAKLSDMVVEEYMVIRKSHIKMFEEAGMSPQKARDLAVILATLESRKHIDPGMYDDCFVYNDIYPLGTPATESKRLVREKPNEENISNEHTDETDNYIKLYNDCLKRYDAEKKNNKLLSKENKALRHEINMLKKELEKFNVSEDNSVIDVDKGDIEASVHRTQVKNIEYPYYFNDYKITLFGGFDVFHRELRKYLPDIRIVDLASKIDTTPIKNSDLVFIQTNKTNHGNYWTIVNACKSAGVKHFHLNYASAKKCAEIIVTEIEKIKEREES